MDSTRYVEKRRKGHHHPNELHLVENGWREIGGHNQHMDSISRRIWRGRGGWDGRRMTIHMDSTWQRINLGGGAQGALQSNGSGGEWVGGMGRAQHHHPHEFHMAENVWGGGGNLKRQNCFTVPHCPPNILWWPPTEVLSLVSSVSDKFSITQLQYPISSVSDKFTIR
jgi:hypothetical protein